MVKVKVKNEPILAGDNSSPMCAIQQIQWALREIQNRIRDRPQGND